jgi:Short C-terminal domain/Phospholipase_D-nuclease N-terminal
MSVVEVMVSIFWFMLLVAWFWLMIVVISDIFRDHALSGWAKALWCIFVILAPWLGVLVYLIARGKSMGERTQRAHQESEHAFRQYVREAATTGPSMAEELGKLADLRDRGAITPADYENAKAKLLGPTGVPGPGAQPPQPSSGSAA